MKFLKEYWFIFVFVLPLLGAGIVWLVDIDSKTFDSPEQKVEHEAHVKSSLSPKEQWQKYYRDSMDVIHRQKEREERTQMMREKDSIDKIQDSIFLDIIQRNADQIYQIKEQLKQ